MNTIVFQIAVPIAPNWSYVELLRTSVLNCLTTVFHNHDFGRSIGMVTRELLENALKFGDWNDSNRALFTLNVFGNKESVTIEVSNPVLPGSPSTVKLKRTIDWLGTFEDAKDAYLVKLSEVAEEGNEDPTSSGLGLPRIAYEGNCVLSAVFEENVVRIRAVSSP